MQQHHNVRAGAWRGRAGLVVKAGLQELEEAYYLALRVPSECPLAAAHYDDDATTQSMERNLMCLLPEYPVSKNPLTVQLIAIIDIGLNRRPNKKACRASLL